MSNLFKKLSDVVFNKEVINTNGRPSDWRDFGDHDNWNMYFKNKELKKKIDKIQNEFDINIKKTNKEFESPKIRNLGWDSDEYRALQKKVSDLDNKLSLDKAQLYEEHCDNSFSNIEETLNLYRDTRFCYKFIDVLTRFKDENRFKNLTDHEYWKLIIYLWRFTDCSTPQFTPYMEKINYEKWKSIFLYRNPVDKYKNGLFDNFVAFRSGSSDGFSWTLSKKIAQKYREWKIMGKAGTSKLNLRDKNIRNELYEELDIKYKIREREFTKEDVIFYHNQFEQPKYPNGIHEVIILKNNTKINPNPF